MNSVRHFVCQCNRRQPLFGILQRVGFKSKYSLDKIYPNSSLDLTTDVPLPQNKDDSFSGTIPMDQLSFTFSNSSGPGGQNVNKVQTKVDLRFHVMSATWIPEAVREDFVKKYYPLINKDGFVVLKSDRTRYKQLNVADCLDKLRFMVREAQKAPAKENPEDLAVQLARHEKATRERLRQKRVQSEIKRSRSDTEF